MEAHPVGMQAVPTPTQVERSYTFGEHGLPWIPSGHVVGEEDELEFDQVHRDDFDGQIAGVRDFDPPPKMGSKRRVGAFDKRAAKGTKSLHEPYEAYVPRAEKKGAKKAKSKSVKRPFANDEWANLNPEVPLKTGEAFDAFDEEMFDRQKLIQKSIPKTVKAEEDAGSDISFADEETTDPWGRRSKGPTIDFGSPYEKHQKHETEDQRREREHKRELREQRARDLQKASHKHHEPRRNKKPKQ